jgi:hypothetical protein
MENMASAAHQYKGLHNHARPSLLDQEKRQKPSGTAGCLAGRGYYLQETVPVKRVYDMRNTVPNWLGS